LKKYNNNLIFNCIERYLNLYFAYEVDIMQHLHCTTCKCLTCYWTCDGLTYYGESVSL